MFESILRAHATRQKKFVMAELGARWGTWGSHAVAFWKRLNPESEYDIFFVETERLHCDGIEKSDET